MHQCRSWISKDQWRRESVRYLHLFTEFHAWMSCECLVNVLWWGGGSKKWLLSQVIISQPGGKAHVMPGEAMALPEKRVPLSHKNVKIKILVAHIATYGWNILAQNPMRMALYRRWVGFLRGPTTNEYTIYVKAELWTKKTQSRKKEPFGSAGTNWAHIELILSCPYVFKKTCESHGVVVVFCVVSFVSGWW